MREYVVRRIGQLIVTYWAFLTILFVIFRLAPGDPTTRFVLEGVGEEERQQMIENMGLNEPLYIQYINYLQQLMTGDWGRSFSYGRRPVWNLITQYFWNTIFLMMAALVIAFALGIAGGAALAWWRGRNFEVLGIIYTLFARSTPVFWTGLLMIILFVHTFDLFPVGGMRTPGTEIDGFIDRYVSLDFLYHMVLPLITGVIFYMAVPTLLMRNSMLEILNADFMELKRAEGLPLTTLLYKHAVRNSILPIVTIAAIIGGRAMGGQVLIEYVFNWPGMGTLMVDAVQSNDYPLAQATFFLMGSVVIFFNFVADLLYAYLDPRVEYE